MKKKLLTAIILLAVGIVAVEYSKATLVGVNHANAIVFFEIRPFVYRALVPWLARCLVWMGLQSDAAVRVLAVFSAMGLFYGLIYFFKSIERA